MLKGRNRAKADKKKLIGDMDRFVNVPQLMKISKHMRLAVDILFNKNKEKRSKLEESTGRAFLNECLDHSEYKTVRQMIIKAIASGRLTERRTQEDVNKLAMEYIRIQGFMSHIMAYMQCNNKSVPGSSPPRLAIEKKEEVKETCKLDDLTKQFLLAIPLGNKTKETVPEEEI